jgi:hypothetical protein
MTTTEHLQKIKAERELAEAMDDAKTHKQMLQNLSKTHALERAELDRSFQFLTKQRDDLAEIYPLLASAWFHGGWKAETCGEREMQKIMECQGWWPFESEADLMTALAATKGGGL